jgi:excisionase family DNA binding protein
VSVPEAAEILGISRESGYRAAGNGDIFTIKFGRKRVVPMAWLEKKLAGGDSALEKKLEGGDSA